MCTILQVNNLMMKFEDRLIFDRVSFTLKKGSTTALLGSNGTGKTTLIKILMGMLPATSGDFQYSSKIKVAYVPQFRNLDADYPLSIRAFVELNMPLFKSKKIKRKSIAYWQKHIYLRFSIYAWEPHLVVNVSEHI